MKNIQFCIIISCLIFFSCHHKEKINLCNAKSPVSASFTIKETLGDTLSPDTDTIYVNNTVVFTANQDLDSYLWKIGGDPREWTTKEFKLDFDYAKGQLIPITLIGKKSPDHDCFPNDNGVDTITRTFYVADLYQLPSLGNYSGANQDTPNSIFTVKVDTFTNSMYPAPNNKDFFIANIPDGCNQTGLEQKTYSKFIGGNSIYISSGIGGTGSCNALIAFGVVNNSNKSINIKYSYLVTDANNTTVRKNFTFNGKKQ